MSNIRKAASGLAAYGRFGDSLLVHMTPREVRGLASIAPGGRLTTNPRTGLPEAFVLEDLLPIAAGIAGSVVGGPVGGAVASGAAKTATTGDLAQGFLAGATSFGMGSMMQGLGSSANELTNTAAAEKATEAAASQAADKAAASGVAPTAEFMAPTGVGFQVAPGDVAKLGTDHTAMASAAVKNAQNAYSKLPWNEQAGKMWQNAGSLDNWKHVAMTKPIESGIGLLGTAAQLTGYDESQGGMPKKSEDKAPVLGKVEPRKRYAPPTNYRPGYDPEFRYFAGGGDVPGADQGIGALQGRLISGPGGGRDDLVPAMIDGEQPAALSAGEFVLPAEIVSMLGNGSNEEGARKLDKFVKQILTHKGKEMAKGKFSPDAKDPMEYLP